MAKVGTLSPVLIRDTVCQENSKEEAVFQAWKFVLLFMYVCVLYRL